MVLGYDPVDIPVRRQSGEVHGHMDFGDDGPPIVSLNPKPPVRVEVMRPITMTQVELIASRDLPI